jgi:hypothetical protein
MELVEEEFKTVRESTERPSIRHQTSFSRLIATLDRSSCAAWRSVDKGTLLVQSHRTTDGTDKSL